ncbi:MAG: SDR family oxidoreductase [Bacteroidota bacterium]|nr:SDR family oxidoreductase [Bacteroidota bacterium]
MNLVTGATGILGSTVVLKLLQQNEPVTACKQKTSDLKKIEKLFSYYTPDYKNIFSKIKWVDVDIRDIFSIEEVLDEISIVYNCAGFVSFNKNDRKLLFDINEKGTANVVTACLHKKIDALCHVSSIATLNNLDYKHQLNETVFWKTSGKESDYAISKYNGEREVWRGIEEGLNAVIVNPGVILSPGFWNQSSSKLFPNCYNGNKYYTKGMAGYVSAIDVAEAMIQLVTKRLFANRYIVIENNYNLQTILNLIQTEFNKPLPSINASKFLLNIALILDNVKSIFTRQQPTITKNLINSAFNTQTLSNNKILTDLELSFQPINEVIHQICGHYLREQTNKSISN